MCYFFAGVTGGRGGKNDGTDLEYHLTLLSYNFCGRMLKIGAPLRQMSSLCYVCGTDIT